MLNYNYFIFTLLFQFQKEQMIENTPIDVTVLMPVYNSERYLKDAIVSILNQTFKNFELLIVNDGSLDRSDEIIRSFKDSRIIYINNATNSGIVDALNEGLKLSRGTYIARMDADDVANPNRLALQFEFLKANPDYKLCGTNATLINHSGEKTGKIKRPYNYANIKVQQFFRNAFIHPTIMADAALMKSLGYAKDYEYAEDYFLFSQIAMRYKAANINYEGIQYRVHNESISAKKLEGMVKSETQTMVYLLALLFDEITNAAVKTHHLLLRPPQNAGKQDIKNIENHLINIKNANQTKHIFDESLLEKQLQKEWFETLKRSNENNKFKKFVSSKLFSASPYNLKHLSKLLFA